MAANVGAMSKRSEWRERAAPCLYVRAAQQKELAACSRGAVAGRPVWSRTVHDRKGGRRQALGHQLTASECGRSNPRFEPTPRPGMKGPGCEAAMNSVTRGAGRSAILNRVMAAAHRPARGSSARRYAQRA